jgi:methionyl-tRNA synthetase
MRRRFYVTTAIDYVNASPHLGHAYEKLVTDCLARYHRQRGDDTFFLTGADEHGMKIAREAEARGIDPQIFTDELSARFRTCWDALHIGYDRYVRTTEHGHEAAVQEIFRRCHASGDIYLAEYEGLYCVACEAFYQGKDLLEGELCPVHKQPVQTLAEKNFFFRLSKYADRLRAHIKADPQFIQPDYRRNEVLAVIEEGLQDVSISRASVPWGIAVPPGLDEGAGHTVYVWFDALINYVSAIGFPQESYREWWCAPGEEGVATAEPNALHIIGKDISRFHCLLWPSMLWSAGMQVPRSIFVHGFIKMGGEKMSKTEGRIVDPLAVTAKYGVEALRYYILREVQFGRDGDYDEDQLRDRYNTDLANELGNLASRACSMVHRYRGGVVPSAYAPGPLERDIEAVAAKARADVQRAFETLQPAAALEACWTLVKRANRYVEETKPWVLAKDPAQATRLDTALVTMLECARLAGFWAWPAIPAKAEELWRGLGLDMTPGEPPEDGEGEIPSVGAAAEPALDERDAWFASGTTPALAGSRLPEVKILFPKADAEG